jgi:hypothetical protein
MKHLVRLLFLTATISMHAQILPDRLAVYDPLGDHAADTAGFQWLPSTRLFAEFSRYSNGSGAHHRWNAKTGGYFEIARWDSSWSIAMVGTMEMVADPFSDIGFNPRAIFWEEGLLASRRLGERSALEFGYVHRCKHDIDNLEPYTIAGRLEQETLIYSGITTRALWRPAPLLAGPLPLDGALAVRNDFFLHLFDQREPHEAQTTGHDMNTLADAVNITVRLDFRERDARWGVHLNGDYMLAMYGSGSGLAGRWSGISALGSVPFLELGLDLFNPHGAAFTLFARGEWQRDGAITPFATPARLFSFGVRAGSFGGMW